MLSKIKKYSYKIFIEYFGILFLALLAIDLITKGIMQNVLTNGKVITLIPGCLEFTLVYNTGSFAGWLGSSAGHIILIIISFLGAGALGFAIYKCRHKYSLWLVIGLVLALAGDVGNLVDRLIYVNGEPRGVIDFIHFFIKAINFNWPVFNIADALLVVGLIMVMIALIVDEVKKSRVKNKEIDDLEKAKMAELDKDKKDGQ